MADMDLKRQTGGGCHTDRQPEGAGRRSRGIDEQRRMLVIGRALLPLSAPDR